MHKLALRGNRQMRAVGRALSKTNSSNQSIKMFVVKVLVGFSMVPLPGFLFTYFLFVLELLAVFLSRIGLP